MREVDASSNASDGSNRPISPQGVFCADAAQNNALDRVAALVARIFEAPAALLALMLPGQPPVFSAFGLDERSITLHTDHAAARLAALQTAERHCAPAAFPTEAARGVREPPLRAEVFLRHSDGVVFGILCLPGTHSRAWTEAEQRTLEDIAALTVGEIERQRTASALMQSRQRAEHLTYFDALTGLPNRRTLLERLGSLLEPTSRNQTAPALLLLDLDRFKVINDTLGHRAGDALLQRVAERLRGSVRKTDLIAHLGGDEFLALLPQIETEEEVRRVAQKLGEALKPPFLLEGREVYITASIGISVFPADGMDTETLLMNADIALHRAKQEGRDGYRLFAQAFSPQTMETLTLETSLHKALENGAFVVHYQPQVDLMTGQVVGAEALVRWQHPERGLVPPVDFIPLAEENGLILPISRWVLQTACEQAKSWQEQGFGRIPVAVNLSLRQFQHSDLRAEVAEVLRETGLPPDCLDLEITENIAMQRVDSKIATLRALKALGVRLSLDDFGTGYSSLNYLKRLPIDIVKIDRSFVRMLTTDPRDAVIAAGIISMAHDLNLAVIAEGVDRPEQLTFLRERRCDAMQGFLFSKALPADQFARLMTSLPTLPR